MKTATAQELFNFLEQVIHDGYGHAVILFDTEAKTFNYHMAKVDRSFLETEIDPGRPMVILLEESS